MRAAPSSILLIAAIFLAGCGSSEKIVCEFDGGKISAADVAAMEKIYPATEAREQAILRMITPVHAKKHGYALSQREQRRIIKKWIDDYYGGDSERLEADAAKSKTTPEDLQNEILYQNLYTKFEAEYLDVGVIQRSEAVEWYRDNPQRRNGKVIPFGDVEGEVIDAINQERRDSLLKKEFAKVKLNCDE